ncbi:MAG TPA: M20/M25/M40 family metallo-hydrolase [Terriglobia bacterium]|nr:M20/M25/M40 family metallo-hydrolase [Terriglobia bacterium]
MRAILFDLGDTLEHKDRLLPGALQLLDGLRELRDDEGKPPVAALISDWDDAATPAEVKRLRRDYYALLERLGLSNHFKPLSKRVTLSTEFDHVYKPDRRIFRAALDKLHQGLPFHHAVFVTENATHVAAARELGMMAIHFKGPGQSAGEVRELKALLPILKNLLAFLPCGKRRGEAIGRTVSPARKSKKTDEQTKALLSQVSEERLRKSLSALVQFGTRWTYSPKIGKVPGWIQQQLKGLGYGAKTRFQPFDVPGRPRQRNVLCGPSPGTKGIVLVCCHYDSISEKPSENAPGADDDASGVAAILELARLLKPVQLKRDLLFAAFGGEEQGLFGSTACAAIAAQKHWPIDVVINLDMISYKRPGGPSRIVVEYDQGNRNPGNDSAAKAFGLVMAQAATDYTRLAVEHTDIWNSDYLPFEAKGFACIGAYNADENPFYHKSSDGLDNVDVGHLAEVVRMVLATIIMLAK